MADAVLYEGYVLYPYRASAIKNRYRWQFGVVAPRAYAERSGPTPGSCTPSAWSSPRAIPSSISSCAICRSRSAASKARLARRAPAGRVARGRRRDLHHLGGGFAANDRARRPLSARAAEPRRIAVQRAGPASLQELSDDGAHRGRVTRRRRPSRRDRGLGRIGRPPTSRSACGSRTTRGGARAPRPRPALRRACVGTHVLVAIAGGRFLSLAILRRRRRGRALLPARALLAGPDGRARRRPTR